MAKVDMNFPPNSDKARELSNRPPIEPVVNAASVAPVNKKPGLIGSIISPDVKNLGSYLVYDVLIPFGKNLLIQALDITLNGGIQNRSYSGYGQYYGRSYTNYRGVSSGNVYNQASASYNFNSVRNNPQYPPTPVNFTSSEIDYHNIAIYNTIDSDGVPVDANLESANVLRRLQGELAAGHIVTVADLYRACNITPDWTWENMGWAGDPGQIGRMVIPNGYRITVPDARDVREL